MTGIYLSLGSNLGDRLDHLRQAIARLPEAGVTVTAVSSVYETEPVGLREQPWFLNCVVEGKTAATPLQLMRQLLQLEARLGRRREGAPPQGPRVIDLDLIFHGAARTASAELTLPHPRYHERRFVLAGLAELAPDLRDPGSGRTMKAQLDEVADCSKVTRREVAGWPPD